MKPNSALRHLSQKSEVCPLPSALSPAPRFLLFVFCYLLSALGFPLSAFQFTNVTPAGFTTTLNAVASDNQSSFVAVGQSTLGTTANFNLTAWATSPVVTNAPGDGSLFALTYGAGEFVAGGLNASTFHSTDRTNWLRGGKANNLQVTVPALAFNANISRFASVGLFPLTTWTTDLSAAWTPGTLTAPVSPFLAFHGLTAFGVNSFAACGDSGTIRISNDGGQNWFESRTNTAGSDIGLNAIAAGVSQPSQAAEASGPISQGGAPLTQELVAVGNGGRVLYSLDSGVTWRTNTGISANFPALKLNAVAFMNPGYLVAADGGRLFTILDITSTSWEVTTPTSANLLGVAFGTGGWVNGLTVVVGTGGTILVGGTPPLPPANAVPQAICAGSNNLPLSVSLTTETLHPPTTQTVDWYSAPTGGALLLAGSTSFTPSDSLPAGPNTPSNYVYFAEQRDLRTGFVSSTRLAVTNTVNPNTAVTSAPQNATQCPGTTASFNVAATGVGLAYQWRSNNVNLVESGKYAGVTTSALTVNAVTAADALTYDVVVSGVCASVTNSATLTVLTNVSATGPVSATNCPGTTATFSTVASGTGPLTYQWRSNGVNLVEGGKHAGVTSATLQINNVSSPDALTYSVVVSGVCTSVTNSAALTVLTNVSIVTPPSNQTECPGSNAVFNVAATGSGLTYQWQAFGTNLNNIAKYLGATSPALTVQSVTAADATTYTVVVSGTCTSSNVSATLTVRTNVSVAGPVAQTNCPGTMATFSTVVSGTGPFTYQWRTNGVNLAESSKHVGVTNPTLQISNVSSNDAATYSVVVGGPCASVTNSASLTVQDCSLFTISREGGTDVKISWAGNLVLEYATNLTAPTWQFRANGIGGATNELIEPVQLYPTNRFYRRNTSP